MCTTKYGLLKLLLTQIKDLAKHSTQQIILITVIASVKSDNEGFNLLQRQENILHLFLSLFLQKQHSIKEHAPFQKTLHHDY